MTFFNKIAQISILAICFAPEIAQAQLLSDERLETFTTPSQRTPKELIPEGVTFRGFLIKPKLSLSLKYDDNILAQSNNEKSDFVTSIEPSVTILKEYDNHTALMILEGQVDRYADQKSENIENYTAILRASINPNSKWSVPIGLDYRQRHAERTQPTEDISTEPGLSKTFQGSLGVTRNFANLSLGLKGQYTETNFDDGVTINGNPIIRRDDESRDYSLTLEGRYALFRERDNAPEHIIFSDIELAKQDYKKQRFVDNNSGFSGASGDNKRISFLAGFETSYKGLLFAKIGLGAAYRDYDQENFDNTLVFNIDSNIEYNITPKLSLKANALRFVDEDNDFIRGFIRTGYGFGAEYELFHDWYLNGDIQFVNFDFIEGDREDDQTDLNLGIRHLLSRNLSASLDASLQERTSDDPTGEFERSVIMLNITGAL